MIPIRSPRPIRLEISSRGAAPKKEFGTGAYKFFVGAGFLLVPRGWTNLKQTRDYVFLRPPAAGPPRSHPSSSDISQMNAFGNTNRL